MSFYRSFVVMVAVLGLVGSVYAAEKTPAPAAADSAKQEIQLGDAKQNAATATATTTEKVNLNKATAKELMQIKGLTLGKAKAIVAYRNKHGDFKSLDELKEVKGFKRMHDDMMKEIQDQLTLS